MANVLLVAPNIRDVGINNWGAPPLGIWRIAAHLKAAGHLTWVFDPALDEQLPLYCDWDLIGFSVTHHSLPDDVKLMNKLSKEFPSAVLVAGGIEATLNYEQLFDHAPGLKYVVLAEGEKAMLSIANGQKPEGVIERSYSAPLTLEEFRLFNSRLDFAAMGYEQYWAKTASLYDEPDYDQVRTARLVTSTHCTRNCSFCSATLYHRRATGCSVGPLRLPAQDVVQLVQRVIDQLPSVRTIYFCEDDFCADRQRCWDFFANAPPLRYLVQTGIFSVDERLVEHMGQHGCVHLTLGVENCSPKVQREFGKVVSAAAVDSCIAWCQKAKIMPYLLFILFSPETTVEDLKVNVDGIRRWMKMGAEISINPIVYAYSGTRLLEQVHDLEWQVRGGLKQAMFILPDDIEARRILFAFRALLPERLVGISHRFKGQTAPVMLDLLEELLKEPRLVEEYSAKSLAEVRQEYAKMGNVPGIDC